MSTLGSNVVTLTDWAKRRDPDGKIAVIIEMLSQSNPILLDMMWREGNLPTGHQTTVRTGLPSVFWKILNRGTPTSKSTTAQITEAIGIMESWSEVDEDIATLEANLNEFRLSEAVAFVQAMNQEMASTLFYGNSSIDPEEFTGLAPRYSDLSAANAKNIVVGGGSQSDNSSIWFVCWGTGIHGIYPKGSQAGLQHDDFGLVTVEETAGLGGNRMRAYQDRWKWKNGIAVKDWRDAVRIPNIDVSNLVAEAGAADLTKLMIKAVHRLINRAGKSCAIYMNRTVFEFLDIQRKDDVMSGGGITYRNVDGEEIAFFRGIPIRVTDALLETEALVT